MLSAVLVGRICTMFKYMHDSFALCLDISCPGESTACYGNGICDLTTGTCTCNEEYQGLDCSGNIRIWNIKIQNTKMISF